MNVGGQYLTLLRRVCLCILSICSAISAQADASKESLLVSWNYVQGIDPRTGNALHIAVSRDVNSSGQELFAPQLYVRCVNDDLDVFIDWHQYLGDSAYVSVSVDGGRPTRSMWLLSEDQTTTFMLVAHRKMSSLLKSKATEFVAAVKPFRGALMTAKFDLSELRKLQQLMKVDCPSFSSD